MIQKVKPKQDRTINLRRGEDVLVRCRRHRDDDFNDDGKKVKPKIDRIIDLRPGEEVIVRCRRRRHHDDGLRKKSVTRTAKK